MWFIANSVDMTPTTHFAPTTSITMEDYEPIVEGHVTPISNIN